MATIIKTLESYDGLNQIIPRTIASEVYNPDGTTLQNNPNLLTTSKSIVGAINELSTVQLNGENLPVTFDEYTGTNEITTGDVLGVVVGKTKKELSEKVDNSQIKNTLTETVVGNVLDATQGTVIKTELDEIKSSMKGFHTDPETYIGNTKLVEDGQNVALWTQLGGALSQDTINVKIGSGSIKLLENDTTASNLIANKNNININFDKLNNGEVSDNNDYISIVVFISDITKVATLNSLNVYFSRDAVFSNTNLKKYNFPKASLVTGWNYLKVKKSDFTTTGTGSFSTILSMRILWASESNAINAYVSIQSIQLVKKDPILDIPNPFQRFGVREFTINSGEWYVGKEFSKNVIKEILSNSNDKQALLGVKTYDDFIATGRVYVNESLDCPTLTLYKDENNEISLQVNDVSSERVRLAVIEDNVTTVYNAPINYLVGDDITLKIEKSGTHVIATVSSPSDEAKINITSSIVQLKLAFGSRNLSESYIITASITEIAHAHHANIAEVAKSLVEQPFVKVRATANQSIPSTTEAVALIFDTVLADNRRHFDINRPTELVVREGGVYSILALVMWVYGATGYRRLRLVVNGVVEEQVTTLPLTPNNTDQIKALVNLKAGDKVTLQVWQNSGGALSTVAVSYAPHLIMAKVG